MTEVSFRRNGQQLLTGIQVRWRNLETGRERASVSFKYPKHCGKHSYFRLNITSSQCSFNDHTINTKLQMCIHLFITFTAAGKWGHHRVLLQLCKGKN